MKSKVRVIDQGSQQVLFECEVILAEEAYVKAAEYEALGLDIKVDHPSVNQTLATSLGVEGTAMEALQESLAEEIEGHESCCYDEKGKHTVH
jgi:aspartate ammonia-lyase